MLVTFLTIVKNILQNNRSLGICFAYGFQSVNALQCGGIVGGKAIYIKSEKEQRKQNQALLLSCSFIMFLTVPIRLCHLHV